MDIIQLIKRANHKTLATWAADCAERVLSNFENKSPNDDRPRKAVAITREWVNGEIKVGTARRAAFAAHDAARSVESLTMHSACWAARSAGHAVATAHVPTHAIHAAMYAVKSVGQEKADFEREWQFKRLQGLVKYQKD